MTKEQEIEKLVAAYEEATDEVFDAQAKVARLEGRLRRLTGCDCRAVGMTCPGHDGRAPYTPRPSIGTAIVNPSAADIRREKQER